MAPAAIGARSPGRTDLSRQTAFTWREKQSARVSYESMLASIIKYVEKASTRVSRFVTLLPFSSFSLAFYGLVGHGKEDLPRECRFHLLLLLDCIESWG